MPKLEAYFRMASYDYADWLDSDQVVSLSSSPEGKTIARHDLEKGEIIPLFNCNEGIRDLYLAPNGDIFFCLDSAGTENLQVFRLVQGQGEARALTADPETSHQIGGLLADGKTLVIASNERAKETFDIVGLDIESGDRRIIIQNDDHYNFPAALSADGRFLLVTKLRGGGDNPLWLVDTAESSIRPVPDPEVKASFSSPVWKSDGSGFFCVCDQDSDFAYVAWCDREASKLDKRYAFNWDVDNIALSFDDRYLAINVNEDGYSRLYLIDLDQDTFVNLPQPPQGMISPYMPFHWSPEGYKLLFTVTASTIPSSLWLYDLDKEWMGRLASPDMAGLSRHDFVEPTLHRFDSFDGLSVPYFLYKPKGATGPMPLMIDIHGGPEGQSRPGIAYKELLHYMVASGLAVVEPNVRGSTGYGKAYEHLDDVEKRLDSVKDIASLIDDLVAKGIADPKRIGVMGASYGGFMTLSAAARMPEKLACAVCTVGMFNLVTFLENTADYRRAHREQEYGSLAKHRDILFHVSPVAKVDQIKGPLMIIHGKNDPRVPVSEAYQAQAYLTERGVHVDLLVYEDEGHGLQKLKNKLDCYPLVMAFVNRHMGLDLA